MLKGPLTMAQCQAFYERMNAQQEHDGFTLWAVEIKNGTPFIGFVGLNRTQWLAHITDAPEIGWRLGAQHWGNGYATEAAQAALAYGFTTVGLNEIVSCTIPRNVRSVRVMQKIGLRRNPSDDFLHPNRAHDDPKSLHVLYRLTRDEYLAAR